MDKLYSMFGKNEKHVPNLSKKLWRNGRPLERNYCRWKNNIDVDLKENTV